jgi:hypothetical protein
MGRFLELIPERGVESRPAGRSLVTFLHCIGRKPETFVGALVLSILIHVFSLSLLIIWGFPRVRDNQGSAEKDLRLFAEAVGSLINDEGKGSEISSLLSGLATEGTQPLPDIKAVFGPGLSDKEKVEVFKALLRSKLASPGPESGTTKRELRLESGEKVFLAGSPNGTGQLEISKLKKGYSETLDELKSRGEYVQKPPAEANGMIRLPVGAEVKGVSSEYFYRACPYEEIMARGASLFSIVNGFPGLEIEINDSGKDERHEAWTAPAAKPEFMVVRLWKHAPSPAYLQEQTKETPKLAIDDEQMGRILDELMAFPEEDQFERFEREFLGKYDLDDEGLARLTREFLYSNINGAFFVINPLTTAFDSLEELYYKKPIFEKLEAWLRKAPFSRTSTELLFYRASSLDFEKRIITHLVSARQEANDVFDQKLQTPGLFNPVVKAFVVRTVDGDLWGNAGLGRRYSPDEAINRYTKEQLRIYDSLMRFGGETRNRALLASGCLLWQEGDQEAATDRWQQITVTTKLETAYEIKRLLDDPWLPWQSKRRLISSIDEILAYDSAKNSGFLNERAVKYHRWNIRSRRQVSQDHGKS